MKLSAVIFLLFLVLEASAQKSYIGKYQNYIGCSIALNSDSTFEFQWHFDLSASWTQGLWTVKEDTVILKALPVYDTFRTSGQGHDSLVLSDDRKSEVIKTLFPGYLISGGQNKYPSPSKLYYKREKLFEISSSEKIIRKKQRGFSTKKRHNPWYVKMR
jgi:hypothetical protein